MKKFERLIIYPLLIVSLFYSFSPSINQSNALEVFDEIITQKITIIDNKNGKCMELKYDKKNNRGEIQIKDNLGTTKLVGSYMIMQSNVVKKNNIMFSPITPGIVLNNKTSKITLGGHSYKSSNNKEMLQWNFGFSLFNSKEPEVIIGDSNNESGLIKLFNPHGDSLVNLGSTNLGHGGIWIYDKYGEDTRYYGHDSIANKKGSD
jgi:hypothetical protein